MGRDSLKYCREPYRDEKERAMYEYAKYLNDKYPGYGWQGAQEEARKTFYG